VTVEVRREETEERASEIYIMLVSGRKKKGGEEGE